MSETYTCALCGDVFESSWSDEAANAEYYDRFAGVRLDEPRDVVCDPCYQKMSGSFPVKTDD